MVGFVESVKTGRHSLFHEMIDGIRGTVRGEGSYRGLDVWRLKEGRKAMAMAMKWCMTHCSMR